MAARLELIQIGDSVGVILPEEALARLRVGEGDVLHLTESPTGVTLTTCDPAVADRLEVGGESAAR